MGYKHFFSIKIDARLLTKTCVSKTVINSKFIIYFSLTISLIYEFRNAISQKFSLKGLSIHLPFLFLDFLHTKIISSIWKCKHFIKKVYLFARNKIRTSNILKLLTFCKVKMKEIWPYAMNKNVDSFFFVLFSLLFGRRSSSGFFLERYLSWYVAAADTLGKSRLWQVLSPWILTRQGLQVFLYNLPRWRQIRDVVALRRWCEQSLVTCNTMELF